MLPFVLLFVTTMACSSFSQDSMMFIDRILEQFSGTKRLKPSISKPKCPRELNASWLLRPPFTTTSGKNANEVGGMFHYVFDLALNKCCAKLKAGNKSRINFKTQALNRPQLHDLVLNNDHVHLILPVQSDEDKLYKMTLPFIKILDSPGVVLIQRSNLTRHSSWMMSNREIWSVISSCLPIIALTILLSFVAGIFVWMMEMKTNTEEFGRPFHRGIFDGFWWAFVTMSTVGYGDKTPKSVAARLFAVGWIMIGVTICSILTATLSSALTSVTVESVGVIAGIKVGATRDSIALQKAANLGANVRAFEDLNEVYDALTKDESIEGMMEEVFTAMEYIKKRNDPLLSVVHFFEEKHGYGVAFKSNPFGEESNLDNCIKKVVQFIVKDDKYAVISKFVGDIKNSAKQKQQGLEVKNILSDLKSPMFITIVIGLGLVFLVFLTGFIWHKYCRLRRKNTAENTSHASETGECLGENCNRESPNEKRSSVAFETAPA
ncbi:hypothetical protein ABFA07_015103 [Porites harrisoni]